MKEADAKKKVQFLHSLARKEKTLCLREQEYLNYENLEASFATF